MPGVCHPRRPPAEPAPIPPAPAEAPQIEAHAADPSPIDQHEAAIEDESDDDDAHPDPTSPPSTAPRAPALVLDDAAFARALKSDRESLGPMSIGRPSAGILVNGVELPENPAWRRVDPGNEWGTRESIDAIAKAIARVGDRFSGTPVISIGHISSRHGGPLSPHKSHQAGRDVDIGYYYTSKSGWFARANADNLDRPRTWELVKAFAEGDVEMIFIDSSIQRLLRDYALSHGEDRDLVDRLIQVGSKAPRTVVRHIPGHATHLHVRFSSPIARDVGARAEPFFRAEIAKAIAARAPAREEHHAGRSKEAPADKGQTAFFDHRVQNGDTMYRLAKRYGTTVEAIQRANGLKGVALKQKSTIRIPKN